MPIAIVSGYQIRRCLHLTLVGFAFGFVETIVRRCFFPLEAALLMVGLAFRTVLSCVVVHPVMVVLDLKAPINNVQTVRDKICIGVVLPLKK